MKIAICDDDEWIRRHLESLIEKMLHVKADLYAAGEDLLSSEIDYDILFLDICLEKSESGCKIDGMGTAKRLRQKSDSLIIFITAMPDYVYEAYDVEAFHYLLKPIDEEKLCEVLKRAASKVQEKESSPPLLIRTQGKFIQVLPEDIFYGENDGRKINLHTKNGVFSYYEKMEVLEEKLGGEFFRSHRGYLVHL